MSFYIVDRKSNSHDDADDWDSEEYPAPDRPQALKEFFDREGYVVVRNAVPKTLCTEAIEAFLAEVKPKVNDFFMRHESSQFERHVFTHEGFMKYPIMNIQDLQSHKFQNFRQRGLDILTQNTIRTTLAAIFGTEGRLIHTMYFDGNQQTWPHRDGDYLDSEAIGSMVGVWVAAEDIHSGAGRFFVYPGSHRIQLPSQQEGRGFNPNSQDYKQEFREFLKTTDLKRVAPALRQGDILIWSCQTIHGSLETTTPQYSRRSFTAHYIPEDHNFVWFHQKKGAGKTILVNGVKVTVHGDQTKWWLQMVYRVKWLQDLLRFAARTIRRLRLIVSQ